MSDSLQPHGLYSPWNSPGQVLEWVAFPFSRGSSQPRSPILQADSLPAEPQGKPKNTGVGSVQFSSVQSFSRVRLFATPWTAACQASMSITNSQSSPRLTSIESVMPSSRLILCRPLLLLSPIPPSIRVFSNGSSLHMRWPKYKSFNFSIIPYKHHPGLISFRMDWLDLLAVQGTLEYSPTPQFKSINSSALSFLYSPTLTSIHDHWKNHSLDRRTFVDKVMSLLFNMLSRLVITFLPSQSYINCTAFILFLLATVIDHRRYWTHNIQICTYSECKLS